MATRTSTFKAERAGLPQTIHYLVQFFFRYFIALVLFLYALSKLLSVQFTVGPDVLGTPIGDLSGYSLTWAYYGYSKIYGWLLAGAQITAGLLLLFTPTVRLGLLLLLPIMGNIVMIDVFYNISGGPLVIAALLLVMGVYLFVSDWRAFWAYTFGSPYIKSVPNFAHKLGWMRWANIALIPAMFTGMFFTMQAYKQQYIEVTPLVGAWAFTEGEWSRLYFSNRGYCELRSAAGRDVFYPFSHCEIDPQAQTVSLEVKEVDYDALVAEGRIDPESDDETAFDRILAQSPTVFSFSGTYERQDDVLRLKPEGGGAPLELREVAFAYGNPYSSADAR